MKKPIFLSLLTLLLLISLSGCKKSYKYNPETKSELKELVDNSSISLGDINTSKITDMSELFLDSTRDNFIGIDTWDVSNVDNMSGMFKNAEHFNDNISTWNVSRVTDMGSMFNGAKNFNQDIDKWDVSNVMNMMEMFYDAESFNQDLNNWQVGAWLENSNNPDDIMVVDDAFKGSPLENNPPYWYTIFKNIQMQHNEEYYNESYDEEYESL